MASAGDGHISQAGFGIVDGVGGRRETAGGARVVVLGPGEVVCDQHTGPFTAFGLVGGGDGDLGLRFGDEPVDGGEDGVGAVGVDKVDQRLQITAGRVVDGVVL